MGRKNGCFLAAGYKKRVPRKDAQDPNGLRIAAKETADYFLR